MQVNRACYHRIWWAGILIVYILLRIQPVGIPLDRDEGVFGLIGRTILEGGLPYLDGIDHKPPLVFYIYAVILSIFPPTATGIHLFLHLYNFITLVVAFLVAKRIAGVNAAYWVAFFYAVFSINPYVQGFTASTEMFMLLPIMVSLWLALRATEDGRIHFVYLALSGVFGALACWCKQPAVFSVFFAVILVVYRIFQFQAPNSRIRNAIKAVLVWLAGGVGISLLIVAYFAQQGILDEFMYWGFQHSMLYSSGQPIVDKMIMSWYGLLRIAINTPVIFIVAICAVFLRHETLLLPVPFLYGFIVLSIVGASIGFAYSHYYAQLIPSLALIAGISCNTFIGNLAHVRTKYMMVATLLVAAILAEVLPNSTYHLSSTPENFSRHFFGINPFPESILIANYLKNNTNPEDRIFIFGSEPQILLLAERASATPFYVVYPLMRSEFPRHLEFQERVIEKIKETRPKYIISVLLPPSLLYDGKAELRIAKFLNEYTDKYYRLENRLFFSEEHQSWLSSKHVYFQQGGKRSDASIALHRRVIN